MTRAPEAAEAHDHDAPVERCVDAPEPPDRPVRWAAAVLACLLAVDVLLGLAPVDPTGAPVDSPRELHDRLARLARQPAPHLLVGDSVLAGDVLAAAEPQEARRRVLEQLDGLAQGSFDQVALNGLLVRDAESVLAALDRADPAGRVAFVLELNPRMFSPLRTEDACSRAWLCGGLNAWLSPLGRFVPVLRHRDRFDLAARLAASMPRAPSPADGLDADAQRARLLAHYDGVGLDGHGQAASLARILGRLRGSGRPALLFATPLQDDALGTVASEPELGAFYSQLGARAADAGVPFAVFDHPLFRDGDFVDHCHLRASGNHALAWNLAAALGLTTEELPPWGLLVGGDDPDRTLVGHPAQGYAEGPAWAARFRSPVGVDVSADGQRIVVADRGNHVLRQLRVGSGVTELLAGVPGESGRGEGPATSTPLTRPSWPVLVGDDVWFLTDRRVVRRLSGGLVEEIDGPWTRPRRLRSAGDQVYVLDEAGIWRVGAPSQLLVPRGEHGRIRAFDVAADGRVWFADGSSRVWFVPGGTADRAAARLLFPNTGQLDRPKGHRATWPLAFDRLRLRAVHDLRWVERYGGLLVADRHPTDVPDADRPVTERTHLRLLLPEEERVVPWLKPLVHGEGHALRNEPRGVLASYWHHGEFALTADATLIWLERDRSRLVAVADGVLGLAKTGHSHTRFNEAGVPDALGSRAGAWVTRELRPQQHLGAHGEGPGRLPSRTIAYFGNSVVAISDRIGQYSLGRRTAQQLRRRMRWLHRADVHLFLRAKAGAHLHRLVSRAEDFVAQEFAPDVVAISLADFNGRSVPRKARDRRNLLRRLVALELEAGVRVVLLDHSTLAERDRDALRDRRASLDGLVAEARDLGLPVFDPAAQSIQRLLAESPWSNQPWDKGHHHGAPWAIDAVAELEARWLEAQLLQLDGPPNHTREGKRARAVSLRKELSGLQPPDELVAYTAERDGRRAEVVVDAADSGERSLQRAAAEALAGALVEDGLGDVVESARVRVLRFAAYDEYGDGALDAGEVAFEVSLERGSAREFLDAHLAD